MFVHKFIIASWHTAMELAPWLFLGAFIAGLLHVVLPADFIRRHLGGRGFSNVVKAALLGVPMPLCSCGVIPAGLGLKKDGASDGATVAFIISTPQTGVDSIAVSAAFLGLPFAIFKVFSAFVTGLAGGFFTGPGGSDIDGIDLENKASVPVKKRSFVGGSREVLEFGFNDLLRSIWRWVFLGILISAAITMLLPEDSLEGSFWATGFTGMLSMLVISLPMYVCATGSVPIAASLVRAGMSPGAALVFLMAGPATNVATLGAVYKILGKRALTVYLSVIIIGSMSLGWAFDTVLQVKDSLPMMHEHGYGWLSITSGVGLLVLFAWFMFTELKAWHTARKQNPAAESLQIQVQGMTCEGCAGKLRARLAAVPGVTGVNVELATGQVEISGTDLNPPHLRQVITGAGYNPVSA